MRILIYGDESMGSLLYELFCGEGHSVERYNESVAISSFDVLFICVPWEFFERALREVSHKARRDALLVDTLQEKDLTIPMLEGTGFDYFSIYPLMTIESKITDVVVVRKSGKREEKIILDAFAKSGSKVVEMNLHEYQKWLVEDQVLEGVDQMRNSIRSIDRFILKLLERRIEIAQKIARRKSKMNEAIEVREVEEEKMREILSETSLNPLLTKEIFELIMKLTKEEEYKALGISRTVAILGPKGSFSEEMGLKLVGSRVPLRYCFTTDEIIKLVESGEVDYGIAPIENSTNGTVFPVLDALLNHDVEVFGESNLEINQCLVAKRRLKLNDIKRVLSHPQAVAQCMGFLNNYLSNAEIRYTSSTSDAVNLLDDYSAAIMSENGARLHKLYVLRKGIQDLKKENITRFYIIRKRTGKTCGRITSLFFSVEDRPGSLKDALEVFQRKGFNLRKLESRPAKTVLGDYVFFVEVEAPLSEEDLKELREVTAFYKVIGVFDTIESLNVYE